MKLCRNRDTRKFIKPRTSVLDPHGVYLLKNPEFLYGEEKEMEDEKEREKELDKKRNEKYSDFFSPDDLILRNGIHKLNNASSENICGSEKTIDLNDFNIDMNMNIISNNNNVMADSAVLYLWIGMYCTYALILYILCIYIIYTYIYFFLIKDYQHIYFI